MKNAAMQQEIDADKWLDQFSKHELIGYYRRRMQEVGLSQKHVIKLFLAESEKGEQADPDTLAKLAATIRENAKLLSELGLAPPILSRLQELIPQNVTDIQNNNIALKDTISNNGPIRERIKSGLYPPANPEPVIDPNEDPQRVF